MLNKNLNQKRLGLSIAGLAAAAMFAAAVPATPVNASGDETALAAADLPLIGISTSDTDPMSTLKAEVIKTKAEYDENVVLDVVDIENSTIEIDGFDRSKLGIQPVTAKVTLATKEEANQSTVGYSFVQDLTVQMVKSSTPTLKLTSDSVTISEGDNWNPASYISYIDDDSGVLPALKVEGDVNTEEVGEYSVLYTAIDIEGNKATAELAVTVEESAASAAAQRQQEELARQEAERQSVEYAGSGAPVVGSGSNPYYGGWSNCTWGAWQLAHDALGVSLPEWGWAGSWVANAQATGYATGSTPVAGSIAVYSGHVAYVSEVSEDGSMIHIQEGGFAGGYNDRWCSAYGNEQALVGYVYIGG